MKKRYVYVLMCALITLFLVSCSAKSDMNGTKTQSAPITYGTSDMGNMDAGDVMPEATESKTEGSGSTGDYTASESTAQNVGTNRKLIKKVYLDLQTLEFTNTLNFILDEIKKEGGYVENSNIQGNAIHENDRRSAKLIIRIPSDSTDAFVNLMGENASVISKNEETKDITKEYVDTKSRIKMLQIEQDRLLSFLEKAETLEDMITLEDRLGEVRYELEEYASTLKTYENLVEYSTVTISIYEVKEIVAKVEKQSAVTRMGSGLNNTFTDIKDGFTNFFVWLVVNLPYFVIWGGLIAVCIVIGIKANKKYKSAIKASVSNPAVKKEADNKSESNK